MRFPSVPLDATSQFAYTSDGVEFPAISEDVLNNWLDAVASDYNHAITSLSYVFCNDEILHRINVERLSHDTLTDIITFDLSEPDEAGIDGECYLSTQLIQENAIRFGVSFMHELHRVMVHGLLHLCGFKDDTLVASEAMRAAEDKALDKLVPHLGRII